jgi:hypothetical protein
LNTTKRALVLLAVCLWAAPAVAQQPVVVSSGAAGAIAGSAADAESNTEAFLGRIGMRGYFFNGTTWDRMRGDTTNGLWVQIKSPTTFPVSGTVTANMGTVTADPFGANADAASATGSISAKLRFIASTGIPITGSVTVGQATGTNLHIVCDSGCSSSTAPADEAAFTAGTTPQSPVGGFFQTTATNNALTNGQMGAFQVTAQRALFSNLRNASGTEIGTSTTPLQVTLANTGANTNKLLVTPDSVALPANQSVNVSQLAGTTTDTNSGTKSAGTLRVVLATDQPQLTNKLLVTPDANSAVNVAQWNGSAVASPDANSYPIHTLAATATSTTATSVCNILSAASTNSTNCKGSAGNFYGFEVYNTTTTVYYLRLYNLSSAPTCSSATGFIRTIPIPPAGSAGQVGGVVSNQGLPVNYGTGIGYCITAGSSSTDNTSAATGIFGEIRYK